MNILITILTSYNEFILYECYSSLINQINIKNKYDIIIVVNSLNKNYINNVKERFKNIDVKIIETISNGRPGMGHNSCIELFKNNKEYDYLIPIDGDDFIYPYGLSILEKSMVNNPDIIVGGNEDVISNFKEIYKDTSIDLNHKYFLNIEPNILIKKEFILGKKGTPFRLILLKRSIFNLNIDKYYCEECKVFDDYLLYLYILDLNYKTNLNIYFISLKNIYIYYKGHISSVCYENSSNCDDNLLKLEDKFELLKDLSKKIKLKLNTIYLKNVDNSVIKYEYEENNNIKYNIDDFRESNQYKLNLNFNRKICEKIFKSTNDFIENVIKEIKNYDLKFKSKIYLILENHILNKLYDKDIIKKLLIISNNINYISNDIIDIILNLIKDDIIYYINEKNYIENYKKGDLIYSYFQIKLNINNIIEKNILYYYYNLLCIKLNKSNNEIIKKNLVLDCNKETIIMLDYMNIEYIGITPYLKGLGGTQQCYIYLSIELSKKYNVIILNKNKERKQYNNNIYFLGYEDDIMMLKLINIIKPNILVYNYINIGELLKKNIDKDIKLYMYEHITIYSYFEMKLKSDYLNYYDKIIFVSNQQKKEYLKYKSIDENKIIIQYNGLSEIFNNNILKKEILEIKELQMIYISNPQRGLDNLIEIYSLLKKKYSNLKLKIYSSLELYDIEDTDELKEYYKYISKMKDVEYMKSISQLELINELNKTLLFIYPTNMTETFCNSMIEAMSCGCYVIANNIGALKEVGNPYGYYIDINIEENEIPPYDNIINKEYLDEILLCSSNVIEDYINKNENLEIFLNNQIKYIKNKYKWNLNLFNNS